MTITRVRVSVRDGDPKFKATATICFDDCFVVREVKVIHGQSGMFISMPSRRNLDGSFSDVAHPITAECRKTIEAAVLEEFERELRRVASGESQARKVTNRPGGARAASARPARAEPRPAAAPPASAFDPSRDIAIRGNYGPKDEPPPSEGEATEVTE